MLRSRLSIVVKNRSWMLVLNISGEGRMGMDNGNEQNKRPVEGGKKENCCDLPNMNVIKGLVAIFLGTLFVLIAHKVIMQTLLFVGGLALIYYGLMTLDITQINVALKMVVEKIRTFCRGFMK